MSRFELILIKPSHYDRDGYVLQFARSIMPSNSLAALAGIAEDCARRRVLGEDVEIRITAQDEVNSVVRVPRLLRRLKRSGGRGMVGLVGVQTNQYPRALELARRFRAHGVPVCIGGFHVSGVLAMLPEITPELQEALDLGVSLFAGEAEGRFDDVLRDAERGALRPIYNYLDDLPGLEGAPVPILAPEVVARSAGRLGSFDAGRGCPFRCSFCTIINVQGRTSRYRTADDIELIVRRNLDQGVKSFFVTDDDFARNRNWEEIVDRLIDLREREGLRFHLNLQVDAACHKLPNFIAKAARAGVTQVFIGLESVNPNNLGSSGKAQNRITEYRGMLQEWRRHRVLTIAGYIVGFPDDTPQSIARDIEIVKQELPIDILELTMLTPLPGSADHRKLHEQGVAMEPDLNQYNLNEVTVDHPRMSAADWKQAYLDAWESYFSPEHVETLLRRAWPDRLSHRKIVHFVIACHGSIFFEGVPPLESGFLRRKVRRDRRPGRPIESPWAFYPAYWAHALRSTWKVLALLARYNRLHKAVAADPAKMAYTDRALAPVTSQEFDELEIYRATPESKALAATAQKLVQLRSAHGSPAPGI